MGSSASSRVLVVAPLHVRSDVAGLIYVERDGTPCTQRELGLVHGLARILSSRLETLELLGHLLRENSELKESERSLPGFLGVSEAACRLRHRASALVHRDTPVLILGEAGSGRETLARHIHASVRDSGALRPFVVLDATPTSESAPVEELFGSYERAMIHRTKLDAAHGGTLCIRDVEKLPRELQVRLAKALTNMKFDKGGREVPLDIRLIVTSSLRADELFARGALAPPLEALLGKVVLAIPPLSVRPEDIQLLAAHLLEDYARERGGRARRLSPRALDRLRAHRWPGNVTELRQVLATAAVLAPGRTIYPKQIPIQPGAVTTREERPTDLPMLAAVEKDHVLRVLDVVGGNKVMAAKVLGIATSTLYEKLRKYKN